MVSSGYAVVDGLRIRYLESGRGRPVVFIHGLGGRAEAWLPQLKSLSHIARAIALDLRGFGSSETPASTPTLTDYARDVIGVLDWLGVEKAVVAGSSMGGLVAVRTYTLAPGRVEGLILSNTYIRVKVDVDMLERALRGDREARSRIAERLTARRLSLDMLVTANPRYMLRVARMISQQDLTGEAASIRRPTLLIAGEHDKITPPTLMKKLQELIPGARLTIIKNAGHLTHIEKPIEYLHTVEAFLETL